ncbi:uncharacterized protein LOC107262462 [Ricinus communis]|uniref:uncharacterized protein LOC107262462 n=1 Tax=Ricinus communis TaxID=3988 RepID=UPI000772B065|nr:uncharacterized protein LOC107262462 [Ricinus communis]|eukprot:XP_015583897.1 uncharacterized protein LOC107262462 [Ricinus communis]
MAKGADVSVHVLKLINLIERLEIKCTLAELLNQIVTAQRTMQGKGKETALVIASTCKAKSKISAKRKSSTKSTGSVFKTKGKGKGKELLHYYIDDLSLYGYLYLMKYKSKSFTEFKEFMAKVENQTGLSIKALEFDRAGEYLSSEFEQFLKEHGIVSQLTPLGTP